MVLEAILVALVWVLSTIAAALCLGLLICVIKIGPARWRELGLDQRERGLTDTEIRNEMGAQNND